MEQNLEQVKEQAEKNSHALIIESEALQVIGHETLEYAALLNTQARDQIKVIKEAFKPHKDNAFKAHKDLCKAEQVQLDPFNKIAAILKPKIIKYTNEQEAKRLKEKQEAERKQRELEAEAKRLAGEAQEKHAENLMDAGDLEMSEAVIEAPVITPVAAIIPDPEPVKVSGVGTKKVWKARVLNFSRVKDMFKVIDQKGIDRMAKICQNRTIEPGLEFYTETQLTGK